MNATLLALCCRDCDDENIAFAVCVHGDHYCLQVYKIFYGGGGGLPPSSAPRRLKLTGSIDISHLSTCAKWLIFEMNSSKISVFGYFNHFMLFRLKNKVDERFPHEKIYHPANFHGDMSPMDREIKRKGLKYS